MRVGLLSVIQRKDLYKDAGKILNCIKDVYNIYVSIVGGVKFLESADTSYRKYHHAMNAAIFDVYI